MELNNTAPQTYKEVIATQLNARQNSPRQLFKTSIGLLSDKQVEEWFDCQEMKSVFEEFDMDHVNEKFDVLTWMSDWEDEMIDKIMEIAKA